jgi:hypothetical protein
MAAERFCRSCGATLPPLRGSGRPPQRCDACRGPREHEQTIPPAPVSSPAVVVERTRQMVRAYVARDVAATRAELRALAREAQLLAAQPRLGYAGGIEERIRIAAERDEKEGR